MLAPTMARQTGCLDRAAAVRVPRTIVWNKTARPEVFTAEPVREGADISRDDICARDRLLTIITTVDSGGTPYELRPEQFADNTQTASFRSGRDNGFSSACSPSRQ